jgi:hypothetical protein
MASSGVPGLDRRQDLGRQVAQDDDGLVALLGLGLQAGLLADLAADDLVALQARGDDPVVADARLEILDHDARHGRQLVAQAAGDARDADPRNGLAAFGAGPVTQISRSETMSPSAMRMTFSPSRRSAGVRTRSATR